MKSKLTNRQVNFWRPQNINDLELVHAQNFNHAFPLHMHEEYVIGVTVRGLEKINHRRTIYLAPAGSLVLFNPGDPHANYSVGSREYRMFHISDKILRQINFDVTGREHSPRFLAPVIQRSDMFNSVLRLHAEFEQTSSILEQESEFISVMARLIAKYSLTGVIRFPYFNQYRYIKIVRDYLEANYAENVSLRHLASISNISRFHLLRSFQDKIGLSPFEYQTQLRISHAKKLLLDGLSIADAAAETGFVDQSHLTKHFKRVVGITPGKYLLQPQ